MHNIYTEIVGGKRLHGDEYGIMVVRVHVIILLTNYIERTGRFL